MQPRQRPPGRMLSRAGALGSGGSVLWPERLPDLAGSLPCRTEHIDVELHEAAPELDRLLLRLGLDDGVARDQLLGLCEWPIDLLELSRAGQEAGSHCAWPQAPGREQHAGSSHL